MPCPVCNNSKAKVVTYGGPYDVQCPQCGQFEIGDSAEIEISPWTVQQRTNLSGWLREHKGVKIFSPDIARLATLRTPTVGEKAQRLMMHLAAQFPKPGEYIPNLNSEEFLGVCWVQDREELSFILNHYLIKEEKFIEQTTNNYGNSFLRVTPTGWAYLDTLINANPHSQIGFIAMWFDESVKQAWIAIESGIREAGYKPFRVDQKEHNNDITDEIIAGIRGSKFLIADLTKHRNGVYFEAGFARGLGLEVIWLCRKSDEKDRHFDIRQFSCIFWDDDKLPELSKALTNRIVATIGKGHLN